MQGGWVGWPHLPSQELHVVGLSGEEAVQRAQEHLHGLLTVRGRGGEERGG